MHKGDCGQEGVGHHEPLVIRPVRFCADVQYRGSPCCDTVRGVGYSCALVELGQARS